MGIFKPLSVSLLIACVGYVTTPTQAEFQMNTQTPITQASMG